MKKILLLSVIVLMFSCNNQAKEEKATVESKEETSVEVNDVRIGRNNYAVVWNWTTTDKQLVADNASTISDELTQLWKDDVVENAYYDAEAQIDKFENYPNITFFLKAKSMEEAEVTLNKLTIVKKGIAVYTIYPVGMKWLGRQTEVINDKGVTKSYVAVWNTVTKHDNSKAEELVHEYAKEQSDAIVALWNGGIVENAYFDIEGTQKLNNRTDFVFFINANSEEEAKEVCDNLPFAKHNVAAYMIRPVGVFWMGEYNK